MRILGFAVLSLLLSSSAYVLRVAANPDAPLSIYLTESVNATVETDGVHSLCGPWNVTGNVTIKNGAPEVASDLWVPLYLGGVPSGYYITALTVEESPSYASVTQESAPNWVINTYPAAGYGDPAAMTWVHITELRPGDRVVLRYVVNGSRMSACPPIEVSESIYPEKIVDGQSQQISLNLTIDTTLPSVSVRVRKVLPADNKAGDGWANAANNPVFTDGGTPDAGGTSLSADGKSLYWTGDGSWPDNWFTVTAGSPVHLRNAKIQGTPDLSEVGGSTQKIGMGTIFVQFHYGGTLTGNYVGYVYSVGRADLETQKEQGTKKADSWTEAAVFYDTSGTFDYEVVRASVWATTGRDPGTGLISGTNQTSSGSPLASVGPGEASTSYRHPSSPYNFTYSGVPKVWASFRFRIQRDEVNGWWNYTGSINGENSSGYSVYVVREKIWAVRGYLVKARKEVRGNGTSNVVCVTVELHNVGEWPTPYVEFYDLVPAGFAANPAATEGNMIFRPLSMLAQDADPGGSPPDYSLKTNPTGYSSGYVWKSYPIPAPQRGFSDWFAGTGSGNARDEPVVLANGTTVHLHVYPVDDSTVNVNGTDRAEGSTFTVYDGQPGETNFTVSWVQDGISGGGKVVISAQGLYPNLNMPIYNPVVVHYCLQGSGDYNVSDVYVVGVDPRNTLDASAVITPSAGVALGASTPEPLVAAVVLAAAALEALLLRWRSRRG